MQGTRISPIGAVTNSVVTPSPVQRLGGIARLTRLPQSVATAVLVSGLAWSHALGAASLEPLLLAGVAYLAVSGAGFAINDYFDIEIDAINKPQRPLPSGLIRPREALAVFTLLFGLSLALPLFVNARFATLTVANSVLVTIYSAVLKRKGGLLANVVMGLYVVLLLLSGVSVLGRVTWNLALGCLSPFFYMVGAQIVMGGEDVEGDAAGGARTLPLMIGVKKALWIATALMVLGLAGLGASSQGGWDLVPLLAIVALNLFVQRELLRRPEPLCCGRMRRPMALSMMLMVLTIISRGPALG